MLALVSSLFINHISISTYSKSSSFLKHTNSDYYESGCAATLENDEYNGEALGVSGSSSEVGRVGPNASSAGTAR